jgi:hypothetical protein
MMILFLNLLVGLYIAERYDMGDWLDACPDPSGLVILLCLVSWPLLLWRVYYISFRRNRHAEN